MDALPDVERFKREHPESYDFFKEKVDLPGKFSKERAIKSAAILDAVPDVDLLRTARRGVDCY